MSNSVVSGNIVSSAGPFETTVSEIVVTSIASSIADVELRRDVNIPFKSDENKTVAYYP